MVAGWNRFFHNIPSVQDSQGPRDEAKSYRPAIPLSLACPPLVQGHNDFIGFISLTLKNGAHLSSQGQLQVLHRIIFMAFTSEMVLLANISRTPKQLPLTARTWAISSCQWLHHDTMPLTTPHLHGELHFSHLGLRLWSLHHALWHHGTNDAEGAGGCFQVLHDQMWKQRSNNNDDIIYHMTNLTYSNIFDI